MTACRPTSGAASSFLSDGGRDANVVREFDTAERRFVEGGFSLPDGKQSVAWLDADTILVAREWGPDTMTASGYPFVIRKLRRGQTLDQAEEVYRGTPQDVQVAPVVLRDSDGVVHGVLAYRGLDFFHNEFDPVPRRAATSPCRSRSVRRRSGSSTGGCWSRSTRPGRRRTGVHFATDSLVSYDLAEWKSDPIGARPSLVWAPGRSPDAERRRHQPRQAARHHPRQCPRPCLRYGFCRRRLAVDRDRAAAQRHDSVSPPRRTRTTRRCSASPTI